MLFFSPRFPFKKESGAEGGSEGTGGLGSLYYCSREGGGGGGGRECVGV